MIEKIKIYNVELLTPSFCKIGEGKPEIRGTSIRGMIREWKSLLGLGRQVDIIWGGRGGQASKVGISVNIINQEKGSVPLLPHKHSNKPQAILEYSTFDLTLTRLVGCTESLWEEAKQDVKNWLMLGCLGQRANRAAGSVWETSFSFDSTVDFLKQCPNYGYMKISNESFDNPEEVRKIASDTVNNTRYFGSFKPRTPSPTKMKVIKIADKYHLLMFAKTDILNGAITELKINKHDKTNWDKVKFL